MFNQSVWCSMPDEDGIEAAGMLASRAREHMIVQRRRPA